MSVLKAKVEQMSRRLLQMFIARTQSPRQQQRRSKLDANDLHVTLVNAVFPTAPGVAATNTADMIMQRTTTTIIPVCCFMPRSKPIGSYQPASSLDYMTGVARVVVCIYAFALFAFFVFYELLNSPATYLPLERLQIAIHLEELINVLNLHVHSVAHVAQSEKIIKQLMEEELAHPPALRAN